MVQGGGYIAFIVLSPNFLVSTITILVIIEIYILEPFFFLDFHNEINQLYIIVSNNFCFTHIHETKENRKFIPVSL